MDAPAREFVQRRACDRCEYCGILQVHVAYRFQIEHVIARQHLGSDDVTNLALACERCNAYKGTNLSAIDPETGNLVRLFNPRLDSWPEHFRFQDAMVIGLSDVGRATVRLLKMNSSARVELRILFGAAYS